ncbi:major facilitator superfamily domain-containing protein [Mycena albidolilacea]|uniref:Major facilitator superfamily domain-containing protein n=1 Tax=Mycena albidolilacea TaxID=1033008 RepID=A0AAD7ABC9_9AGAR|nr:major facilitator superfamily domain-containing protein [Mycena albidolilacea]
MDETTALLPKPGSPPRTPLPKLQLSVILFIQICEPLASQSIYPYINQLVSELDITGGDEKKVGYYACESLFFLTEAVTVLQWSRASDHVGRKPILLLGLFGTGLSIMCFGLSRTFWTLVVRSSVVGDLTDRTNRGQAIAYFPAIIVALAYNVVIWSYQATLGPFLGGTLARPHDRFPKIFPGKFWQDFPYFLPCLVTGSFVFLGCLVVLVLFKESVPPRKPPVSTDADTDFPSDEVQPAQRVGPRSVRELLVFPVLISISNYVALAFLSIALSALLPLFLAMPLEIGGLGLPPSKIGFVIAAYGVTMGLSQFLFFARAARRFGEKRVFVGALTACLPIFALFPIISVIAQRDGVSPIIWVLIGCMLVLGGLMDLAFGAIFMFVQASAPKSSRGTANGMSQTSASLARALGPALSTSLFSLSVEHNLMGGYFVYFVFFAFSMFALVLAGQLPEEIWDEVDD